MNIVDLIEELDGAGLVITDSDELKKELANMGISLFTTIEYNGEPEDDIVPTHFQDENGKWHTGIDGYVDQIKDQ
jgi:hypothetical protein